MDNETQTTTTTPRRLHRRSSGRMLAGVSGGLADYTGLDPVLFRIGFIVLSLAGGSGLLLYALGWLLVPEENHASSVGLTLLDRLRGQRWVGFALLAVFAMFLLNWIQLGSIDWNVLWAIGLISIGFVLLRDEPDRPQVATTQPVPEMAPGVPQVAVPKRRPKRARSPLGFMTLGAAFVAVAIAGSLLGAGVAQLDAGQFVALVIMTIGLGLVVGAWWGRARILVLLAMFLVPVMVVTSMVDVPLRGSLNQNQYVEVHRGAEREYRVLAGSLTLDFGRYRFGDKPTEIDVSFVAGNMNIYVPPGVDVTVEGEVDVGRADVFGDSFEGRNLTFGDTYRREGRTEGELVINVDGGLGLFDTTWATWVDRDKRNRRRDRERQERKERDRNRNNRRGVKKGGRAGGPN